jgi:acyl-CoA synthetase (AMP-forming)/AMP-acid ligase II
MSLGLLLEMAAGGHGDRVALGSGPDGTTFARLAELAAGGGAVLADRGAREAVLLARNGPILPHLLFAAAHAGLPLVPLNYRLSAEMIREQLARLDAPFVVADEDYWPVVAGHAPGMTTAEFLAAAATTPAADDTGVDPSAPAVLLFTSGTTAQPKVVPLRHENLQAYILGTVEFGSAGPGDAALVTVPPYHVAAISSVLSNLYAGRRVVYLPDFDAGEWLRLVRAERITTAMVVPTMLARIVEQLDGAGADAPSLRVISYGGARMPVPVLEKALTAFPDTGFVNAYGLTETSSTIALLGPQDHREAMTATDARQRARLGSAGRAVPGIELQIRDGAGVTLGPDEVGELWVRGPQVVGEYLGVGSVLDADGWFPTNDRAWLDADGYLFIEGRADDTIIRGGENIAPAEVEDALLRHPAVADAAVVGIADEDWGQRLVAVVVRRAGADVDEEALKQHVRQRLRGSRTPDEVVFRAELPHTATGKLLRRDVVDDVSAERGPRSSPPRSASRPAAAG